MQDEFYGNEACCGSYACLNAMKDKKIPLKLFEISTSVPFGIRHAEDGTFDRLLTTYCDPNKGIDKAVPLWGYEQKKKVFGKAEQALEYLREELTFRPAVLGPLDMGFLTYLPVSHLYRRMDHYLLLEAVSDQKIRCVDSEGIYGYMMEYGELLTCIKVDRLPEASGRICVRSFVKRENFDTEKVIRSSFRYACENLKGAEGEGQGSRAYENCYRYLAEKNVTLWKLSLLYDISCLLQRKLLFMILLKKVIKSSCAVEKSLKAVNRQYDILTDIFAKLKWKNLITEDDFRRMSEEEKNIMMCMKEVVFL